MVEHIGNRITHLSHRLLEGAGGFGGIGAIRAFLIGRLADAADRGQGAVQNADDLPKRDVLRGFSQGIPAPDPAAAGQQSGTLEGQEDLFEKFHRDMLAFGDFMPLQHPAAIGGTEFQEGAKPIFAFLREPHRELSSDLLKNWKNKRAPALFQVRKSSATY